jgi:hypothetical protein
MTSCAEGIDPDAEILITRIDFSVIFLCLSKITDQKTFSKREFFCPGRKMAWPFGSLF